MLLYLIARCYHLSYDFKSLSPLDFEELSRDLLQKELGIVLESFKSGPDQGIDHRHYYSAEKYLVVQCKHYPKSGFSQLLYSMKGEVEKVENLNPTEYKLITSFELSPADKKKIFDLLPQYFKTQQNIWGAEDLNNCLNRFPEIEKQHYKLWLTSVNVLQTILQTILNNATHQSSKSYAREIHDKARFFVKAEVYSKASNILKENSFLIISGDPGVGKTTLANILAYEYMANGYDFIKITENVKEAWDSLENPETKQVFYYDDFLGQTTLAEKRLGKNEDDDIWRFMNHCKNSKGKKKFILTTREYIFQQASSTNEKLDKEEFLDGRCKVQLTSYSKLQKAEILYNHFYFSNIGNDYNLELCKEGFYNKVIEHPHYNPRLIETMVKRIEQNKTAVLDFQQSFIDILNDPDKTWLIPFESLTPSSKKLLVLLLLHDESVEKSKLLEHFKNIRLGSSSHFQKTLKETHDSFLKIDPYSKKLTTISFLNPSIKDFLKKRLFEEEDLLEFLIEAVDSVNKLYHVQSVIFDINVNTNHSKHNLTIIKSILIPKINTFVDKLLASNPPTILYYDMRDYSSLLESTINVFQVLKDPTIKALILRLFNQMTEKPSIISSKHNLLNLIKKCKKGFSSQEFESSLRQLRDCLFDEMHKYPKDVNSFKHLKKLHEAFPHVFNDEELTHIRHSFEKALEDSFIYEDYYMREELEECSKSITEVAEWFEVDDSEVQSSILEAIDEHEKKMIESLDEEEDNYTPTQLIKSSSTGSESDEIDSLFSTLIEK